MADRFNFTKNRLEDAAPAAGKRRALFWDEKVPGLALRVTDKGAKSFYVVKRVRQGEPEWIRLGAFPALSVEQARRMALEHGAKLAAGESVATMLRAAREDLTFEELFEWWHAEHVVKRRSPVYAKDTAWQFKTYLMPIARVKACKLTRAMVRKVHAQVGTHAPYQANRALSLVRAVYNKAIAQDKVACENPAVGVEAFPEQSRERRLLPGEIEVFLEAVAAEPNADIRHYVLLSLFSGVRRRNVLAMRWSELDLDAGLWKIPSTKGGRPQVIPLLDAELAILRERDKTRAESPWVFATRSKSGHLIEPKAGWKRILKRAQIEDLRIHDLRRTLGSWMADGGTPLNVIGKTLNHLSPAATAIYSRLSIDPVRKAKEQAVAAMIGTPDRAKKVVPIAARKSANR